MKSSILIVFLLCSLAVCHPSMAVEKTGSSLQCNFPVKDVDSLIVAGKSDAAVESILKPALKQLEVIRKSDPRKLYCARTGAETMLYLLGAGGSAVVIDSNFALAYYYLAYVDIDRGDFKSAEANLREALVLSPSNPAFLSELGHLYQLKKDWPKSIELFDSAIFATDSCSPDKLKNVEKSRALRGKAYSLVEMNQLKEAKKIYLECLEIDPNDRKAKAEIRYIDDGLEQMQKNKKNGD